MEVLGYVHENVYLRLDADVIEVFRYPAQGSLRVPLMWAGAELTARKHDKLRVDIGARMDRAAPFLSRVISGGTWIFEVPATEEPALRAFLDEAARRGAVHR